MAEINGRSKGVLVKAITKVTSAEERTTLGVVELWQTLLCFYSIEIEQRVFIIEGSFGRGFWHSFTRVE